MKAIAASLITAAVISGAAWASNVTPQQVARLSARVVKLEKADVAIEKDNAALHKFVTDCLTSYVAVSEYGASDAGSGYVFQNVGGDGNSTFNTSALDDTQAGDTPDYQFVSLPSTKECGGTAVSPSRR